ncbi:MAG TPA: gephyrin-like molybdotransferase Glp [Anaeromyxobacteraceae bacterium]|nr:gephyrin-like molybdotransferase Glp [Anaeromyxobacteraceae bacterium]
MDRLEPHRRTVIDSIVPIGSERIALAGAGGRWLAAPALAIRAAPPYTCSAMDGYAVRHEDVPGPVALPLRGTLYAGDAGGGVLRPGETARIFTGAPLPAGADAVVREESTEARGDSVAFRHPARAGENVRPAGEDVAAGAEALPAGIRLGPRALALLAAVGCTSVEVRRRPRVALVSTGDEIVRGRTPDSNGEALEGLLRAAGAEVVRATAGDDPEALRAALRQAAAGADALVTVGGVSVGEKDLVPGAVAALGAETLVHGVPMKPGKPFLYARLGALPVFGLPGSPSACLVAFEVFARPALLRLAGAASVERPRAWLPLAEPCAGRPGRARFLWAALEPDGRVRPVGRDAAQVRGPALAGALLRIGEGAGDVPEGERVETWLLEA